MSVAALRSALGTALASKSDLETKLRRANADLAAAGQVITGMAGLMQNGTPGAGDEAAWSEAVDTGKNYNPRLQVP